MFFEKKSWADLRSLQAAAGHQTLLIQTMTSVCSPLYACLNPSEERDTIEKADGTEKEERNTPL